MNIMTHIHDVLKSYELYRNAATDSYQCLLSMESDTMCISGVLAFLANR